MTDTDLDRVREKLAERERQELEAVRRRLTSTPCKCRSCVESDVQAREERERRLDRWHWY